ncbi:MAG: PH domain-containing protein [Gemmatimonadetes bacterium]|nr:PH domain-containing protein [Gemmatimonadota bacterium]NIQ52132.1 PH domain-containing protein [Gemmatimonadota bacterium]NIU72243.1 PH domain-containing protein [Gammaproteobacteria bacterium]NIX42762.1 PH domain-containing protein [Gemmatimonadota bacterium]NIY06920.1 PH domain-containing protein [Gemmatimonadota bacterium]
MPSDLRRLHGFTVVSRALRLARQLVLPAVLGGASLGDGIGAVLQWILLILAIPSLGVAFAQWLAFRYRLADDEIILDSGVLSRRRRVIPLARIQNVDLEQTALERLAGVAQLRLETASGGTETEAGLSVLALEEARSLRAELLRRRVSAREPAPGTEADGTPATPPEPGVETEPEAERTLLRLSLTDLAIAGATSNEAGLIAAGLATLLEVADDLGGLDRLGAWFDQAVARGVALGFLGAVGVGVLLALAFVVLGWLVSIVATVVRFHGFTLTRAGDDLRREYGLFSRHHSTVPLERVQAVRIEETLLRRPLGLVALKIETAGLNPRQRRNGAGGGSEAFVPIARRRDVGRLLREVFEDARFEGVEMHAVAPRSLRRGFTRLAVPIGIGAAAAGLWIGSRGLALLALLIPAWLVARAQYRARAWARTPGFVLVRGGVLTRVSWVVPERKIQTLHVRETPFQRRWELATMLVDTAAGGRVARVVDLHRETASGLLAGLARVAGGARRI